MITNPILWKVGAGVLLWALLKAKPGATSGVVASDSISCDCPAYGSDAFMKGSSGGLLK